MPKSFSVLRIALLCAAAWSANAHANIFELRAVYPEQETVYLDADGGVEVPIQIRMKAMGSAGITTPSCDALIDFGDRSAARTLRLGQNGQPQDRTTHRYTGPGTYTMQLSGAGGRTPCDGKVSGHVTVRPANERPPASSVAPDNAQAVAAAAPILTLETRSTGSADACPEGWFLVPGSMVGGRFTCHLTPVRPFACPHGLQFFDSGNTVGCR